MHKLHNKSAQTIQFGYAQIIQLSYYAFLFHP
jgi:hypothetical protein